MTTLHKLLVAGVAIVLVCGCATTKGPSDEELIAGVVEGWKTGMIAQNLDKVLVTYAETFAHPEMADKAALKDFMQNAIDMGYLEGLEIDMADTKTTIDAAAKTATVYPIGLTSNAGSVTIELTLTKGENGWLITMMNIEGM